jgi:hypothetical protein
MENDRTYLVTYNDAQTVREMLMEMDEHCTAIDVVDGRVFSLVEAERKSPSTQMVEYVLVKPDQHLTIKEAKKFLEAQGLKPADVKDLVAFASTYPGVQQKFRVVALGSSVSVTSGRTVYPELGSSRQEDAGFKNTLDVVWDIGRNVSFSTRFLAIKP